MRSVLALGSVSAWACSSGEVWSVDGSPTGWVACGKQGMRAWRVTFWLVLCHPCRLQHCGAPEGHCTPPTAGPGTSCQQATPWLLRPAA